ncbi:MAG TPA: hypothetical protein VM427_04205 [Patescibacteria group bacterium]|nr:hypothetical protein [Patescibacteria group bacterium]
MPIPLDDHHVAIISDACAAAARAELSGDLADLPTAVVDARGGGFAIAIFADDLNAMECRVLLDAGGLTSTVDLVSELSQKAVAPVDEDDGLSIATLVPQDDRSGTIAFGRVGVAADMVTATLVEQSVVSATTAGGWWAMWWQGDVRPATFSAIGPGGVGIRTLRPPAAAIESRIGPASWWLDPAKAKPTAGSTEIHAQVLELSCASGHSSEGRIEGPKIEFAADTVLVTFRVRHRPGGQDCPGHPPAPFTFKLPEPLGDRRLLDGSADPPREATTVPDS